MIPKQKIRVACVKNMPYRDAEYVYVDSIEHAKDIMRTMGENNHYQSSEFIIQGLPNIAAIEVYDDESDYWYFYNDD